MEDEDSNALNAGEMSDCAPIDANSLAENMRKLVLNLYDKALSKDGKVFANIAIFTSKE